MKKFIGLILTSAMILLMSACSSQTEAPAMNAKMAVAETSSAGASSSQRAYINETLGFSFLIPDSWETENYNVEVTDSETDPTMTKSQGGTVTFLFQEDRDNPLLTIEVVPKSKWKTASKSSSPSPSGPEYLAENGTFVYSCTIPQNSTYDVGTRADLYNSMVLPHDDVVNRFKLLPVESSGAISKSK